MPQYVYNIAMMVSVQLEEIKDGFSHWLAKLSTACTLSEGINQIETFIKKTFHLPSSFSKNEIWPQEHISDSVMWITFIGRI